MTFMNPLLLLAALGIGLPILAHLLNRYKVKQTDWAAMRFLNRSVRVRSRQLRLRDLLLLSLRCLAVLLLALALSRPATRSAGSSWLPGERRAGVILALDGSYSMEHTDGDATRFQRALKQIGVISEQIHPGDPVSLVLLGRKHRVAVRNMAYDPDRFAAVLREQQPSPERLDLDSVPKRLKELVEDMDALQKEVYIVTDLQAQGWGQGSTPLHDALTDLGQRASVFLVPVPGGNENLAVTGLDLVSGTLRKGTVARYQATVRNYGQSPASDVEVQCRVEGVQIDSKRIPLIPPGSSETVSLFVPFYDAGPTRITAEITADALSTDNVRRSVAVVRDRVSVVCVDGSTGDAGRLILAALQARADGAEDEDYVVRSVQWPSFPTRDLDQVDVLILADVPEITPDQARQLSRFVRQGNGLVWLAGEKVKVHEWNKLSGKGANALLPAALGLAMDATDSLGVGKPLDANMPDHTVCRPLQSLPEDLLSETRFLKHLQVEPNDTSFPVLNLVGSNSPILLEHSLGRGRVFLFTTSADTAWNNMALTPVFPMLMQQIVTYLVGREFEQPRIVGDSLSLSYVEQPDASDAVFDTPSEDTIIVPVREHRDQYVALLEESREAGFYVARVSVQAPGMPIAVNVDTLESDLRPSDPEEVASMLVSRERTEQESAPKAETIAEYHTEVEKNQQIWWYLMAGLLVLAIGEMFFRET